MTTQDAGLVKMHQKLDRKWQENHHILHENSQNDVLSFCHFGKMTKYLAKVLEKCAKVVFVILSSWFYIIWVDVYQSILYKNQDDKMTKTTFAHFSNTFAKFFVIFPKWQNDKTPFWLLACSIWSFCCHFRSKFWCRNGKNYIPIRADFALGILFLKGAFCDAVV